MNDFSLKLHLCVILCFASCYAVEEAYNEDLQSEIAEYLRSLTQQKHRAMPQNIQPVLEGLIPYPLHVSQVEPAEEYIPSDSVAVTGMEKSNMQIWPQLMRQTILPSNAARAYASVQVRKPGDQNLEQIDARAMAYSLLGDVEAEENLADHMEKNIAVTGSAAQKKSPQPVQQALSTSEAQARQSQQSTFSHGSTETIKADTSAFSDVYFVAIVAGCSAAGIFGVISAGICFYRMQKSTKAAAEVDYPAYGVTGPNKDMTSPNGDRKLAQSAQMYHYQHQKQQMIAVEKAGSTKNTSASDVDSEEENEEGDYTVYECPGLAPTGEMEVKNPLFNDESTPVSPPVLPPKLDDGQNK